MALRAVRCRVWVMWNSFVVNGTVMNGTWTLGSGGERVRACAWTGRIWTGADVNRGWGRSRPRRAAPTERLRSRTVPGVEQGDVCPAAESRTDGWGRLSCGHS